MEIVSAAVNEERECDGMGLNHTINRSASQDVGNGRDRERRWKIANARVMTKLISRQRVVFDAMHCRRLESMLHAMGIVVVFNQSLTHNAYLLPRHSRFCGNTLSAHCSYLLRACIFYRFHSIVLIS